MGEAWDRGYANCTPNYEIQVLWNKQSAVMNMVQLQKLNFICNQVHLFVNWARDVTLNHGKGGGQLPVTR